jgi:dTDP-4-amino-4,6-dideoxy-D-galactose acyltransferase
MADGALALTELTWDSEFFGLKVARIDGSTTNPDALMSVVELARHARFDCLYYLLDSQPQAESLTAQRAGFGLIDLRITLEVCLNEPLPDLSGRVRNATAGDVAELAAIARSAHRDSRFYCDGRFPHDKCDELYATWLARSVSGDLADAVLTLDDSGAAAGYVTCTRRPDGSGNIGLFGVAERARGRGHGQRLLTGALGWFVERGVHRVSVVTQGRNAAAQRSYQRHGFLTRRVQLWYHQWPGDRDASIQSPHRA